MSRRSSWEIRSIDIGRNARVAVHVSAAAGRGQDHAALAAVGRGPLLDGRRYVDRWDRRRRPGRRAGPGRADRSAAQRLEDLRDLALVEGLPLEEFDDEAVQDVAVLL